MPTMIPEPVGLSIDTIVAAGISQAGATPIVRCGGSEAPSRTVVMIDADTEVVGGGGVRLPADAVVGDLVIMKSTMPGEGGGAGVCAYPDDGDTINDNAPNQPLIFTNAVVRLVGPGRWWMESFFP